MQPQITQLQVIAQTIVTHPVGTVILAPDAIQPSGATGDSRIVMVPFTDGTMPVSLTISDLKQIYTNYGTQAANMINMATKATQNQTVVNSVVAQTENL